MRSNTLLLIREFFEIIYLRPRINAWKISLLVVKYVCFPLYFLFFFSFALSTVLMVFAHLETNKGDRLVRVTYLIYDTKWKINVAFSLNTAAMKMICMCVLVSKDTANQNLQQFLIASFIYITPFVNFVVNS